MATGTPFHPRTSELCKSLRWRQWSGYFSASSYDDFVQPEYSAIRNKAAMIDVSPLYKYWVTGPDATALINRVFTRDANKCDLLQAIYTPWCDADGKMRQEGTVFRLAEDCYQVNAAEPAFRWLQLNTPSLDVKVEDRSAEFGALALQGPSSRKILREVFTGDVDGLKFFRIATGEIAGASAFVSRTGYTGDLGYEIWMEAASAVKVWDALIEGGKPYGVTPCGMLAMDIARVEAGFVLINVDYMSSEIALIPSQKFSPYELGLAWAVKLDKGNFVGRDALVKEKNNGCARQLVGLQIDWEPLEQMYGDVDLMPDLPLEACRESVPVYRGDRQIGRATTRVWSTLLKKYIAIATVERALAVPGTDVGMEITVEHERKAAPAKVVQLPHFRPERMRA